MEYLRVGKEMLREQWEEGGLQSSNPQETHSANLQALGALAQLNELLNLDYEQYHTALTGEPPEKDETDDDTQE